MHRNVEVLIGRLATDPGLQRRFGERPFEVLHEQGLELSAIEMEALAATEPEALRAFTAALDPRLRRASPGIDTGRTGGATPAESACDSKKEIER